MTKGGVALAAMVVLLSGIGLAALGPWQDASPPGVPGAKSDTAAPGPHQDEAYLAQRTKGDPGAPMTMYEVADFQCPACRVFYKETMPHIQDEYVATGKLRVIFLNFPIYQIHPNAAAAHELALCAARQDRFWPIHDLLFEHQQHWGPLADPSTFFYGLADSASLERDALQQCLGSGSVRSLIMSEAQGAFNSGIRSTPSFVVEGGLLAGAAPIEAWRPLLDSIYQVKARNGR